MNTQNENGNQDALELETVEEENNEPEEQQEESNTELEAELEKAKELANNYKIRAEKAEKINKKPNTKVEADTPKISELSQLDTIAIIKADIHVDDIKEVADYAALKNISIKEAIETNVVKAIVNERAEERKVAEATHSGTAKRSNAKLSDDILIQNAKEGNLPESDEDMIRLIKARKGIK